MIWVNIKRVFKSGFVSFWRNGFVSLASILVMTVTLSVIIGVIFMSAILNTTLQELKDKVDINVYFVTGASEDSILSMKKSIEALPEVTSVSYVSSEQALQNFKDKHPNDQLILQGLNELGTNPLGATLNIKAKEASQYEGIATFLQSKSTSSQGGTSIIDKVNYYQNKIAIDKLVTIIDSTQKVGLAITLILVIISIIISFNTLRLVIYISRDEIAVMRLVGASNKYIRGPFLVSGIMYGFISAIVTLVIFIPLTYYFGGITEKFFVGINLFSYYGHNFLQIFGIIICSAIFLGAVSSFLAVRRYLKV